MGFWSGERLARELPKGLISDFNPKNLDCATYKLCVGEQAFVTADKFGVSAPNDPLITVLSDAPNHTLRIPPGQFAFLLTHETVQVPRTAIALISMRATYKFKGLINVSGFHVDPGWIGKLLFSVYNAGASEVIIKKLEPLFLIVYADLDQPSEKLYAGASQHQEAINPSLLEGMTGQVFSPLMLQRQMEALNGKVAAQMETVNVKVGGQIEALNGKVATVEHKAVFIQAVTFSATTFFTLLFAVAALFATLAPSVLGVILAKTIDAAGYELKAKQTEPNVSKEVSAAPAGRAGGSAPK